MVSGESGSVEGSSEASDASVLGREGRERENQDDVIQDAEADQQRPRGVAAAIVVVANVVGDVDVVVLLVHSE